MMYKFLYITIGLFAIASCVGSQQISSPSKTQSNNIIVNNISEFNAATAAMSPGDNIILANGVWTDAELVLQGQGTPDNPITLRAEEKGQVFLEGESNLRISGQHIIVEGLVFRNGHTPTGSVISYRTSKSSLCNNCRVTECVIDDYNPSERFESDYWVDIYGKNNRFDHNYLVGKRNRGVTLAVRLQTEESRENYHRIDHNYFGYRPTLGSNGGETLRVGTSHHSLTNSNTTVEDNYFETCSGELEIISSKSCQNTFRNNTFYECQGTLTMRHGNETVVNNNYFFGNRKPNTGGIRIINESQTVTNNYCQGLTGSRFKGALVIMNGVPNSPINRYFPVINSKASNNMLIDCDHVQLCAGSDAERSAPPTNTQMTSNIFYNTQKDDVFTVYDDISGISFEDNILSENITKPMYDGQAVKSGFTNKKLKFVDKGDIKICTDYPNIGPNIEQERPNKNNTGVSWYPKKDYQITFNSGKVIEVLPGDNTIWKAMKMAQKGDIIRLMKTGQYHQSKSVDINHTVTIESANGLADKPELTFERSSLFNIENGGSLRLKGIRVSGAESDDYSGNAVIRTSRYSMIDNYKLIVEDSDFIDLDVNHSFNFLKVFKNTFADSVRLSNCNFENISGHVLNLDKEIDNTGIYNAENVVVENCTFRDIGGTAIMLHRGGKDESTFGPILELHNSKFDNVGYDKRNKHEAALSFHGVQYADIKNIDITDSRKINLHLIVGEPVIKLNDINFTNSEKLESNDDAYQSSNLNYK